MLTLTKQNLHFQGDVAVLQLRELQNPSSDKLELNQFDE